MTIDNLFIDARSALTVVSLLTFLGIVFWSWSGRRKESFEQAANLPFADDFRDEADIASMEKHHG